MNDAPEFYAKDLSAWSEWLERNHNTETAVWLLFDKGKNRTLAWEDIVKEELRYGWIDGRAKSVSDTTGKIYISKRKPSSTWSKINKTHVEKLIAEGRMLHAGQKAIDVAKQNGSWNLLNKSDDLEIPPLMVELFKKNMTAAKNFEAFSVSSKRLILSWIYSAKRSETMQHRIKESVRLARENIKSR